MLMLDVDRRQGRRALKSNESRAGANRANCRQTLSQPSQAFQKYHESLQQHNAGTGITTRYKQEQERRAFNER